jgi:predicted HTH domain antitoxin
LDIAHSARNDPMTISLPDDLERLFTPEDVKLHLALGLFFDRRVTLGQGAAIAGLSQSGFLHELGKRRIPVHYDEADALADVAIADQWGK